MKLTYVMTIDGSFRGPTKEAQSFYNSIKRIAEDLQGEDFHGSIRVCMESSDNTEVKNWEWKLISPPIPKNHRLVHNLEGVKLTLGRVKQVGSFGSLHTQTTFPKEEQMKVFEFDNGGEKDWVIALDEESALKCCKEFHDEEEEEIEPDMQIKFTKILSDEELTDHFIYDDEEEDGFESSFKDHLENMKLDKATVIPVYLTGTMF